MQKKYWYLIIVFILIVLLVGVYMYRSSGEFVSQSVRDVETITVTLYPFDEAKKVTKIIDSENETEKIYKMLKETSNIQKNRYPSHAESIQWDHKFEIDIKYLDGKTDHIFSTEAPGSVCQYLTSKGISGDKGYMLGENRLIWKYVFGNDR